MSPVRKVDNSAAISYNTLLLLFFGAWRSLDSAPALGAGGRRFKSSRPDQFYSLVKAYIVQMSILDFLLLNPLC